MHAYIHTYIRTHIHTYTYIYIYILSIFVQSVHIYTFAHLAVHCTTSLHCGYVAGQTHCSTLQYITLQHSDMTSHVITHHMSLHNIRFHALWHESSWLFLLWGHKPQDCEFTIQNFWAIWVPDNGIVPPMIPTACHLPCSILFNDQIRFFLGRSYPIIHHPSFYHQLLKLPSVCWSFIMFPFEFPPLIPPAVAFGPSGKDVEEHEELVCELLGSGRGGWMADFKRTGGHCFT